MWRHVRQNIGSQQGKSVPAAAAGEDTIARHRLANDNAAPDTSTLRQPDTVQAALFDRLGIVLPKRIRLSGNELLRLALSA
jgi:hypothetical protein